MLRPCCRAVLRSFLFPVLSLAAGGSGAYHWPSQKGTPGRTGFSPYPVPDISKEPTWIWSDPHEDTIRATPLIDDKSNVYLSTVAGRIYKWDKDGKMIWKRELPFGTQVVGCIHDGKFITATKTGLVVAIDMETAEDRWRVPVSLDNATSGDTASMMCYDGLVVSATHNDRSDLDAGNSDVVAVRVKDGAFAWRYLPERNVYNFQGSTPGDGTVVFQDRAGGVYRLNMTDGREIWKSGKLGSNSFTTGAAVCHEGRVLVVSNRGDGGVGDVFMSTGLLHTYRLEDGAPLWEQPLEYSANQAVAIGPHPTEKGKSIAVLGMGANPGFPAIMLQNRPQGPIEKFWPTIYVHAMDLYFGWLFVKNPAAMAAYDPETGKPLWRYELPPFRKLATNGDSERFPRRYTHLLTGVNPQNDIICLPDSCSQPTIGPDGTAYAGWQDGRVYAIKDANGDFKIDDGEVVFHQFTDGFQGSMGMAPGLFAVAPCGGGLYVFRS